MKIFEDLESDEVIINNKRIEGFILDEKCSKCDNFLILYEKYDAYFCAYCNEWKEDTCGNSNCEFCRDRPDKPL
ncbi:MAG: hypothetical protein GX309_04030 [Clostridiales bacterium]|nr:hypothetical protein [Clostridiales bacterium]